MRFSTTFHELIQYIKNANALFVLRHDIQYGAGQCSCCVAAFSNRMHAVLLAHCQTLHPFHHDVLRVDTTFNTSTVLFCPLLHCCNIMHARAFPGNKKKQTCAQDPTPTHINRIGQRAQPCTMRHASCAAQCAMRHAACVSRNVPCAMYRACTCPLAVFVFAHLNFQDNAAPVA